MPRITLQPRYHTVTTPPSSSSSSSSSSLSCTLVYKLQRHRQSIISTGHHLPYIHCSKFSLNQLHYTMYKHFMLMLTLLRFGAINAIADDCVTDRHNSYTALIFKRITDQGTKVMPFAMNFYEQPIRNNPCIKHLAKSKRTCSLLLPPRHSSDTRACLLTGPQPTQKLMPKCENIEASRQFCKEPIVTVPFYPEIINSYVFLRMEDNNNTRLYSRCRLNVTDENGERLNNNNNTLTFIIIVFRKSNDSEVIQEPLENSTHQLNVSIFMNDTTTINHLPVPPPLIIFLLFITVFIAIQCSMCNCWRFDCKRRRMCPRHRNYDKLQVANTHYG